MTKTGGISVAYGGLTLLTSISALLSGLFGGVVAMIISIGVSLTIVWWMAQKLAQWGVKRMYVLSDLYDKYISVLTEKVKNLFAKKEEVDNKNNTDSIVSEPTPQSNPELEPMSEPASSGSPNINPMMV